MAETEHIPEPALAIVNARVFTGDPRRPWADAVLVCGDRVAGVGSSAEIRKRAGASALVIDARGFLVSTHSGTGAISAGLPADLVVIDRSKADSAAPDGEIVFRLAQGKVVVDRDSWAVRER
jgi:predicted amidohydrolase YtcJ